MFERLQKFNPSIFRWGVAVILLVVPLYPKFPFFNIPGTYVAVRIEDFIIAVLFGVYLVYVLGSYKSFFADKINQALFLFVLAGLVSLISGVFLTQTILPHIGFLHWVRRIEYVIPFFIAASFARRQNTHFFVQVLCVAAFLIFVYGLGQIQWGFPVISTQNDEFSKGLALKWVPGARLHSTFAGHYDLSAWLVLFFPFAFVWLFVVRSWLSRAFLFFVVLTPTFWLFMKAESRISFVAFILSVPLALWVTGRKAFILPFLVVSVIGMLTIGNLLGKYRHTVEIYINFAPPPAFAQDSITAPKRIRTATPEPEQIPVVEDRSTSIRFNVEWPRAIRALEKNPLLGTGYSSITLATDSDYLRLLGEVGVLGFMAFFLVLAKVATAIFAFLKTTRELDDTKAFVGGFLGAFVGFLINATFIDVFEASKAAIVFWTLCGITVGLASRGTYETQKL